MSRGPNTFWRWLLYIGLALLLLVLAAYPVYFLVFQISPTLSALAPNLEIAPKWATVVGTGNILLAIVSLVLVFQDRFSRKRERSAESRQTHFLPLANRLPILTDVSQLQQWNVQIQAGLSEAECGATFAVTMGASTKQEIANLISNGIKKFTLIYLTSFFRGYLMITSTGFSDTLTFAIWPGVVDHCG